jgi:hypothetical protein
MVDYVYGVPPEYLSKEFDHSKLSPTEDWVMRFAHDIPGGHLLEAKDSKMQYVVIFNNGSVMLVDEVNLRTMKLDAEDRIHRLGPEVRVKTVIEPVSSTRESFRESSREYKPGWGGG